MKNSCKLALGLCVFVFGTVTALAQQSVTKPTTDHKITTLKVDKSNVKVQRHTVMSRFEPAIASSEEERMKRKQERIADTEYKLSVLDTLDISDRRKRLLLLDLKYTPYSKRLNKAVLVKNEYEETSNN